MAQQFSSPLTNIKIATPCSADWEAMVGNERVRFCGQCQLNVYNLSGYTQPEAEQLIAKTEGRLCVRYHRRADGSVITQDCPTGLQAARQKMGRWATAIFSAVLSFLGGVGAATAWRETSDKNQSLYENPQRWPQFVPLIREKKPEPPVLMGAIVSRPPDVPPKPVMQDLLYRQEKPFKVRH